MKRKDDIMAIESLWCPLAHANVIRVTTFEGEVRAVNCSEYRRDDGSCGLKVVARLGGPLSQLLAQVSEHTLARQTTRCDLA
jgi:hypothetical protein